MKSQFIWAFLFVTVLVATVKADCEDDQTADDSWYKKLGCQIKKGAEDGYEAAKKGAVDGYEALKPLGDKIATSTKDFGSNVAKKFDEVKHQLTDDETPKPADGPITNEPTEKVPLAPLPGQTVNKPTTTGEQRTSTSTKLVEPEGFDDRFLLQNNDCPAGQVLDHTKRCRTAST